MNLSALEKYLMKAKSMAGDIGRAGMGLGSMGALKGLEMAQEHPTASKALAGGAGIAGLLGLMGGGDSPEEMEQEEMQRMEEKYRGSPYEEEVMGNLLQQPPSDALAMRHRQRRGG